MKRIVLTVVCLAAIIAIPSFSVAFVQAPGVEASFNFNRYHTYSEIVQALSEFEQAYSDLVRLYSIGKSFEGRDLYALEITNRSVGIPELKPAMLFVGPHHGNEVIGAEIALYFAGYLLSHYPADARIKEILDTATVYIMPLVNPDGHVLTLSNDVYARWNARPVDEDGDGRFDEDPPEDVNGDGKVTEMQLWDQKGKKWTYLGWEGIDNDGDGLLNEDWVGGVDLNRNYDYQWTPEADHGAYPFSEPETMAIRDFVMAHTNIVTGFDTHSGAELILYPWGYTLKHAPDFKAFKYLGRTYRVMTGYRDIQSALLYPTYGGAEDWMYGNQSIIYFTNEVYGAKWQVGWGGWRQHAKDYPDAEQPWVDFQHPQLGLVEIGGYWIFRYYNPPENEIEDLAARNLPMMLSLAEMAASG